MRLRLLAVLVVAALSATAVAPTAAAQIGYIPPCSTLCLLVLTLVGLVGGCANAEVQQTVYGVGEGGWCTNPVQAAIDCAVETAKAAAGLGPGCA